MLLLQGLFSCHPQNEHYASSRMPLLHSSLPAGQESNLRIQFNGCIHTNLLPVMKGVCVCVCVCVGCVCVVKETEDNLLIWMKILISITCPCALLRWRLHTKQQQQDLHGVEAIYFLGVTWACRSEVCSRAQDSRKLAMASERANSSPNKGRVVICSPGI